jgi:hypothetical protein
MPPDTLEHSSYYAAHIQRGAAHLTKYFSKLLVKTGTAVAQWLRYCATNRKVAGSIPDGVIGIFH